MAIRPLFPTFVYHAPLQRKGVREFNQRLLRESRQLRTDDDSGRRWSRVNYPGGYTSYGSSHHLQKVSPTFQSLEQKLRRHVAAFARAVDWNLDRRHLAMTDCWTNIMGRHAVHGLHLHPLSTLSGTYYVQVPRGAPGIKFEDPRLDRLMAAPPRNATADGDANRTWITLPAVAGQLVLFESWLRHEVPMNPVSAERVSVSFNYSWF